MNLIPSSTDDTHLKRHTEHTSLVMGSKSTQDITKADVKKILQTFDEAYTLAIEKEKKPGRKVFALKTDRAVGTNAVVSSDILTPGSTIEVIREPQTRGEAKVKIAVVSAEDMPTTNIIHGIYGPYSETEAGIYTMIFGDPGTPFPKDLPQTASEQEKAFNENCKQYWDTHVFLVTPEEAEYTLQKMEKAGLETKAQRYKLQKFDGKSPLIKEPENIIDKQAIDLGSIKLPKPMQLFKKNYELQ